MAAVMGCGALAGAGPSSTHLQLGVVGREGLCEKQWCGAGIRRVSELVFDSSDGMLATRTTVLPLPW
jgi:hypothetical protein